MSEPFKLSTRRALLSFFAASPVLYAASRAMGQPAFDIFDPYAPQVISNAQDAINVFDFHEVAKQSLMPGHYTYMALGTDDGGALRANREGFANYQLRMRRLIDTQNVDTSFELFGERYPVPILIAPCGSQKAFHPQDELVTARAARTRGVEQILSTGTSSGVEEVNETRGRPVWFQLYADAEWQVTQALVKRVEAAGCPVLALTVDLPVSNREALYRHRRDDNPECQVCHAPDAGIIGPRPMYEGLERSGLSRTFMDWDYVDRLKDSMSMKLFIKALVVDSWSAVALWRDPTSTPAAFKAGFDIVGARGDLQRSRGGTICTLFGKVAGPCALDGEPRDSPQWRL